MNDDELRFVFWEALEGVDSKPAIELLARMALDFLDRQQSVNKVVPATDRFIAALRAEIGRGEEVRNNYGPHVKKYFLQGVGWCPENKDEEGKATYAPWCAAFVSYALRRAGYTGKTSAGAKRLGERLIDAGGCPFRPNLHGGIKGREETILAKYEFLPGDVLIYDRGRAGSPAGHVAVVATVKDGAPGTIIEGNHGPFPALVREEVAPNMWAARLEVIVRPVFGQAKVA